MWLLLFVVFRQRSEQKTAAVVHHIKNRKKEAEDMEALAKQFTGKECIIYTINSNDGSIAGSSGRSAAAGCCWRTPRGSCRR